MRDAHLEMGLRLLVAVGWLGVAPGCSCDGTDGDVDGGAGRDGALDGLDAGRSVDAGRNGSSDANVAGLRSATFWRGVNPGYYGGGIDDGEAAQLASAAGCDSLRLSLPETHLATWGADIEQADFAAYASLGLEQHVVFLTSPTREHSTAPASAADWELAHYAPASLDEPIFLADGSVNPANHWAAYVAEVATHYGDRIAIYEVWNEPDQVGGNWEATTTWDTEPPTPSDLLWWNASIYAYVRMLRVTFEVVHALDPDALVGPGGLGYPTFLDAILRYSDEPTAGAIDADHPATGGAYMDVLPIHFYPVFTPGNSDDGVDALFALRDAFDEVTVAALGRSLPFVVTETGAPRRTVDGTHGDAEYARNYLVKAMTRAEHDASIYGVHWFALGEPATTTTAFDAMGLYESYASATTTSECVRSDTGVAYATLAQVLDGALAHVDDAPIPVSPSTGVEGVVYLRDGAPLYVLWARATEGETASVEVTLEAAQRATVRQWDYARTGAETVLEPSGGVVPLTVTSSPIFVAIARP